MAEINGGYYPDLSHLFGDARTDDDDDDKQFSNYETK